MQDCLGPFLFNVFSEDLFVIHSDIGISNFADDNTPYLSTKNVGDVMDSHQRTSVSMFRWFLSNLLQVNVDKCHFLESTSQKESLM